MVILCISLIWWLVMGLAIVRLELPLNLGLCLRCNYCDEILSLTKTLWQTMIVVLIYRLMLVLPYLRRIFDWAIWQERRLLFTFERLIGFSVWLVYLAGLVYRQGFTAFSKRSVLPLWGVYSLEFLSTMDKEVEELIRKCQRDFSLFSRETEAMVVCSIASYEIVFKGQGI